MKLCLSALLEPGGPRAGPPGAAATRPCQGQWRVRAPGPRPRMAENTVPQGLLCTPGFAFRLPLQGITPCPRTQHVVDRDEVADSGNLHDMRSMRHLPAEKDLSQPETSAPGGRSGLRGSGNQTSAGGTRDQEAQRTRVPTARLTVSFPRRSAGRAGLSGQGALLAPETPVERALRAAVATQVTLGTGWLRRPSGLSECSQCQTGSQSWPPPPGQAEPRPLWVMM